MSARVSAVNHLKVLRPNRHDRTLGVKNVRPINDFRSLRQGGLDVHQY